MSTGARGGLGDAAKSHRVMLTFASLRGGSVTQSFHHEEIDSIVRASVTPAS